MSDAPTMEEVLDGRLDSILNPAAARRHAGAQLPRLAAEHIISGLDEATRRQWATQLANKTWPAIRSERGRRWDLGWPELTAGLAIALELLAGELPSELLDELVGTAAEAVWRARRTPYQRFVMLVGFEVQVRRVLASPKGLDPKDFVEQTNRWSVDGGAFRDRSHTLMLALLAESALDREAGPVAATGTLLPDGEHVGSVGSLALKAKAWWQRYPNGLLITAAPGEGELHDWSALVELMTRSATEGLPPLIAGATRSELLAKLAPHQTQPTSWDGSRLRPEAVLESRFHHEGATPPDPMGHDPLSRACWAAWRDAERRQSRRGVLLHGPPGSGKSILSVFLEGRFIRGDLGALGFGVRRAARELANDLGQATTRTWAAALSVREPHRAALFEALEASRRLVPIIDGLDELQPSQLIVVSEWLRGGCGWWLATSRPVRSVGIDLPDAWELCLEEVGHGDATKFLAALGREDLARTIGRGHDHGSPTSVIRELTRTPLMLALLAKVAPREQELDGLDPYDLYERAFQGLLDHACRARRLTTEDARLVGRLLSTVVGTLALAWLTSPHGLLSRADIDKAFDDIGMGPVDQVRALEALVFGHLLVPAGAAWEFGHRTIAEWAAAAALHRRTSDGDRSSVAQAECEAAAFSSFADDHVLVHRGRWWTLLRFYVSRLREPLFFLDRLIGPAHVPTWRMPDRRSFEPDADTNQPKLCSATASEILESWESVYELMRTCQWRRAEDAQAAWAIGVRRWLLTDFPASRYAFPIAGIRDHALQKFAEAIGDRLPESLDALVDLAVRTESQRARLDADPLLLLPAIPAVRARALRGLLERGDHRQQLAILEWHHEHGAAPPHEVLNHLMCFIPNELQRESQRSREDPESDGAAMDGYVVTRLEAAAWRACLTHFGEPPWAIVRRRFAEWPSHLADSLRQWFGRVSAPSPWPDTQEDGYRQRREVLAALLERVTVAKQGIILRLDAVSDPDRRRVVLGRVRYFFNDSDDHHLRNMVDAIASAQGWPVGGTWLPGPIEDEELAQDTRQRVVLLHHLRERVAGLVQALTDQAGLEAVIGELWALLDPEHPSRSELLLALDRQQRAPRQIPAVELLRRHAPSRWRLDRLQWTAEHLEQLRTLGRTDRGQLRFDAILALAQAEGQDERVALVQHLPCDDEVFTTLAYERIANQGYGESNPLPVPDPSRLPLRDRAAANIPGWRAQLLAGLADPTTKDAALLVDVAVEHEVREALPLLACQLQGNQWHDASIMLAIVRLAADRDETVVRLALRHALRFGWPEDRSTRSWQPDPDPPARPSTGAVLARLLRIEDLQVLAEGSVSALRHPLLAEAIRGLGPDAIEKLLSLHRVTARLAFDAEAKSRGNAKRSHFFADPESLEITNLCQRRDALAETLIASIDALTTPPGELVENLFQIAGEDVHHVYGTPGPLGSDFDEPGDLDWHADQLNSRLIEAALRALEQSVARHPDQWPELRRLFDHPSESLRLRAFEMCAARAEPHRVAELALDALERHMRGPRARWSGQTAGLLLAAHQRGAGTIEVESPNTAGKLVSAVRKRLTPAHRDVVRRLAEHDLPGLRALAADWACELGDEGWVDFLVPLLGDAVPGVFAAAVRSLASLSPVTLEGWLVTSTDEGHTAAHDRALLQQLGKWREPRLVEYLSEQALLVVLSRTAAHGMTWEARSERHHAGCFEHFPSLVERVVDAWRRPLSNAAMDVFRSWTEHPRQAVRAVGRRLLADCHALDASELEALLHDPEPAERFSAAECIVRMGFDPLSTEAMAVMRGALAKSPADDDLRATGLDPPAERGGFRLLMLRNDAIGGSSKRLRWALQGATPRFAPMLALVASDLPYDREDSCLQPEGQEIVHEVTSLIHRWGEASVAVLELLDQGEIDRDYNYIQELMRLARAHPSVSSAIRRGAERGGGASSEIVETMLREEFERDLEGLATRLRQEVFPSVWPHDGE